MQERFELWRTTGKNKAWFFHLKGRNGKIIAQSEGYNTKRGALNGIRVVKNSMNVEVRELGGD
jgi:uncharacterized protein YegP (UPF0339 family)